MIQYIYFVKCPECEDEPFDFFDEAKGYALGCLGKKPIITQIEVDRNDFGECVDSNDLGTIWSWEDVMSDVDTDSGLTVLDKESTLNCQVDDRDPEFAALDNSLDSIPDNFLRPIPEGMTIKDLVEELEENEDTVECQWCNELFAKEDCHYEVDLGYLCPQCEAAIKSRGEPLTFREGLADPDTVNVITLDRPSCSFDEATGCLKVPFDSFDYEEGKLKYLSFINGAGCKEYPWTDGQVYPFQITGLTDDGDYIILEDLPRKSLKESGSGNWVQVNLKTGEYCGCGGRSWVKADSSNIDRWPTKEDAIEDGKKTYKRTFKYGINWDVKELDKPLTESVDKVKQILGDLVTDTGKIRALRNDEKCPRGFKFLSCDGTAGEVSYNGVKYAFAVVNHELRVMTSVQAGGNWSETILKESIDKRETVDLDYDELTITVSNQKDVDDWDEAEHTSSYTYTVAKDDVASVIWERFLTEEDVTDVPGGLDALEDDELWNKFIETHFDALFEKYYEQLLSYYKEDAEEEFSDNYGWYDYQADEDARRGDYEYDAWNEDAWESLEPRSMLEELEDAESYSEHIQLCPECGKTAFDPETGMCIQCGFNI